MVTTEKRLEKTLIRCVAALAVFASSFLKLGFLCKGYSVTFSAFNFMMPVISAFFPVIFVAITLISLFSCNFLGVISYKIFGFPILVSLLWWRWTSPEFESKVHYFILGIVVPLLSILGFIIHPIGNKSWFYVLYWMIPIATVFLLSRVSGITKVWLRSLAGTFLMHAVGSVFFIYTHTTSPVLWQTLIPVVAFERMVFSIGTVVMAYGVKWLKVLCFSTKEIGESAQISS